jgi:hypothetical protein
MTQSKSQPSTATPWRVFTTPDGRKLVGIGSQEGEGILDCGFGVWAWDDAEGIANANLVVDAVNNYAALKARIEALTAALRESVTDNCWNAYHCGITRDGKWMDGGMSDAEWLQRELGLDDGWHDLKEIQRRIPEVVEKQIAALSHAGPVARDGER